MRIITNQYVPSSNDPKFEIQGMQTIRLSNGFYLSAYKTIPIHVNNDCSVAIVGFAWDVKDRDTTRYEFVGGD